MGLGRAAREASAAWAALLLYRGDTQLATCAVWAALLLRSRLSVCMLATSTLTSCSVEQPTECAAARSVAEARSTCSGLRCCCCCCW